MLGTQHSDRSQRLLESEIRRGSWLPPVTPSVVRFSLARQAATVARTPLGNGVSAPTTAIARKTESVSSRSALPVAAAMRYLDATSTDVLDQFHIVDRASETGSARITITQPGSENIRIDWQSNLWQLQRNANIDFVVPLHPPGV